MGGVLQCELSNTKVTMPLPESPSLIQSTTDKSMSEGD